MNYTKNTITSLKQLCKNPVLFIPDILLILITIILAALFLKINGFLHISLISDLTLLKEKIISITSSSPLLVKLMLSLFTLLIINIGAGLILHSVKYILIRNITKNKKQPVSKTISSAREYVFPLLIVKAVIFLLVVIPLSFVIYLGLNKAFLLSFLLVFLLITYLILLSLALLFLLPILFTRQKNPIKAITKSISFFRKNKLLSLLTFLIISLVSVVISYLASSMLSLAISSIIILILINKLISMALSLWAELFKFNTYLKP